MGITTIQVAQQMIFNSVTSYLEDAEHLTYSFIGDELETIIYNMFHLIGIKPSVVDVNKVLKRIKSEVETEFDKEVKQARRFIKVLEDDVEHCESRIKVRKKELNDLLKRNKKPRRKKK